MIVLTRSASWRYSITGRLAVRGVLQFSISFAYSLTLLSGEASMLHLTDHVG